MRPVVAIDTPWGSRAVGGDLPCRIVAEISNNHNGDANLALKLIGQAEEAGADFVKFQCYHPVELVALRGDGPAPDPWGAEGWTMRRLYEKAATPFSWFPRLIKECREVGVPWFASVFGVGGFALLESLGCPAYKLAALDHRSKSLRSLVVGSGKPIIRSLPLKRPSAKTLPTEVTLYCQPGYPQERIDFKALRRFDGLSYHGTDPLVPVVAVGQGTKMVEVHVQDDHVPSVLEADVSLTVTQFTNMVRAIRDTERMLHDHPA